MKFCLECTQDRLWKHRGRNECDELRAVESQILEREVANIRAVQLIEQDEKRALAAQGVRSAWRNSCSDC